MEAECAAEAEMSPKTKNLSARLWQKGARYLGHRRWPWILAFLSVLLCLPSLRLGFILDDYYHLVMLQGHDQLEAKHSPADLFAFGDGAESPPSTVPWWAEKELRLRFFRPLTSLSRALDHQLWPGSPALMHVHSLLWLALSVLAAAYSFRALLDREDPETGADGAKSMVPVSVAGLAALFFAVDDTHAAPAMWLANRSALLALFFGILSLIAYHHWRRGWRPGAFAAPAALALAMLSAESGLAAGAYLLSYALFLDRGRLGPRLLALLPCTAVGVLWALIYKMGGYGTSASKVYIDPSSEPTLFLGAFLERAPVLLMGQFAFPPADFLTYLSESGQSLLTLISAATLAVIGILLWPLLKREPAARFFAFGMVLSLVPICATLPSNRLLGYVSLGGSSLAALLILRSWQSAEAWPSRPVSRAWRWSARAITPLLLLSHLVFGPIFLLGGAWSFGRMDRYFTGPGATLPSDEGVRDQHAVLLNAPNFYLASLLPVTQAARGRTLPGEILTLATSVYEIEIERLDLQTLRVKPKGGFLMPPGRALAGQETPAISALYFLQTADGLYWDGKPFEAGERIQRNGVEVRVAALTADGRPSEVDFHFESALEDPAWRWLRFVERKGLKAWEPPPVGESVIVEGLGR